ncbi:MAG: DUF1385 domain-containing protein [Actinomycetia bacterium]|nr:DUF1385 domain-containing protein [Actinomycetes bacterium]
MPKTKNKYQVGGQAVIEGVMMRSRHFWSLAVRRPDNTISTKIFKNSSLTVNNKFLGFVFVRGVVNLIESMALGFRALSYSVNESTEEDIQFSKKEMTVAIVIAMVFAVGVFFVVPTLIGRSFSNYFPNTIVYNLMEGLVRIALFLGYILIVSQLKDIKRIFQYHGAEHKTIQAYEHGEAVVLENVKKFTTVHVRCGTSFLLIVMVVAIIVFSFLGRPPLLLRILYRVLLMPVVAGISYELIKLAGKFSKYKIVNILFYPGLLLQKVTTREPDDSQIEVAMNSFNRVIEAEDELKKGKVTMETTSS